MRLLIILLLCSITCRSADRIPLTEKELTLPPYRQFTMRDGLPQMQVVGILQDSRGYIWIGTKSGLACYNGEKFINFTRKQGLADDFIFSLAEDYTGKIWMSTTLGLASYDGAEIVSYPSSRHPALRCVPAPDGKIWFTRPDENDRINIGYFENGTYFQQNNEFLLSRTWNYAEIGYSGKEKAVLIKNRSEIFEYKNNEVQKIFTGNDTLLLLNKTRGRVRVADLINRTNFRIYEYVSGKMFEIARVKDGRIVRPVILKDTLHFSADYSLFPIITVTPDTFLIQNHHGIQLNYFIFDRERKLWIGSEDGLYKPLQSGFQTFKKEYLPQVWAITEDHKGDMWFSSFHFGIKRWDGHSLQTFQENTRENNNEFFHFRPSINKEGTLFFPGGYGITCFDGKRFRKIKEGGPSLTTFYDTENDLLWAGGYKRTDVFDHQDRLVRTIGANDSLGMQRYYLSINKDENGNFWMGGSGCLTKYRWETGEIVHYTPKNGKLPFGKVMTIFNDPYKRMWFGTSDGLFWYDAGKDSILNVGNEDLSGAVNLISAIDTAWLIVSQPIGIYLMDMQLFRNSGEVKLYLFNSENGFQGIEPGQDGAFTDSKGYIWMTSGSEVVRFDPKKLSMTGNMLNVRFSKCNGQSLPFNAAQFRLPLNDQTAIVEFDAICFNRPNPVQYSWKLTKDTIWSPWQESNYAVLSGLREGKKHLLVRARIPGLPLPEFATASLTLQVNLAVYKQAWFFPALFGSIVLSALIILFMLLRTRIRMTQANRQAKVFQIQAIQSQMNPHFIFNALASLQSMILSVNMEKANEYLVKLSALIRGFLEASVSKGVQMEKWKNGKMEITLTEELATLENYISFQQLIYPGRFDYQLDIDSGINPSEQTIPPMLLQPFVENAIRHGLLPQKGKGTLNIHISPAPGNGISVEITDDGIGMEKAGSAIRNSPFRFVSRGRELTLQRIRLMNETGYHIDLNTYSSDQGTKITLQIATHGN